MPAKVEQTPFGVVIEFPRRAWIDRMTWGQLRYSGFVRVPCLTINHWRADKSADTLARANEIVKDYNQRTYA